MPQSRTIPLINNFEDLVRFLHERLDWPVGYEDFEDEQELTDELTFEFTPEEINLPEKFAAKIKRILQLRPLRQNQPWAVFYIEFESKRLPITALRRILKAFVIKKRASDPNRATWKMHDLLFINSHGAKANRGVTFAHFTRPESGYTATMRDFMWDARETRFFHLNQYLESLCWPDEEITKKEWREQWRSAFIGSKRKAIRDSRTLADEMALFAADVKKRVMEVLEIASEINKPDPLTHLYKTFQKVLIHDLSEERFADMYSQTMAYGLFTARFSKPLNPFGLDNLKSVVEAVPETNPFLRDLFKRCFGLSRRGGGKIDIEELGLARLVELFEGLEQENIRRILDEFGSRTGDPVIHFYEGFLHAYDAEVREMRGVYYTPDAVVSYIVRSIHEILIKEFKCPLGLADTSSWSQVAERNGFEIPEDTDPAGPFVRILDPACGTGTFLKHTIKLIYDTLWQEWEKEEDSREPEARVQKWNNYVDQHLLPRLFGFELLPAPYAVCHMKLGLFLKDLDYKFKPGNRLNVYLTNSLEEPREFFGVDVPEFMAEEAGHANRIKAGAPITVVLGNPPYSGESANKSEWIHDLMRGKNSDSPEDYFKMGEKPLGERNPKWLNDDYVKFIRFGQWRLDKTGYGVLGYITNHGYLDNPTFRGMRESLMKSFSEIYILDLHGNAKKKETAPDGSKDENVFDIQQGVAVGIMIKKKETSV